MWARWLKVALMCGDLSRPSPVCFVAFFGFLFFFSFYDMERMKREKLIEHPIHRNNYFCKAFERKTKNYLILTRGKARAETMRHQ